MTIELNLIPHDLRETQKRRRHMRGWAMILAPALGVLVAISSVNWMRQARTHQAEVVADALSHELEQARVEVRGLTTAVTEASRQLKRAEALQSKRSWSGLMGLLAKARPEDVWFYSVSTDPPVPAGGRPIPAKQALPGKPDHVGPLTLDAPRKLLISGRSISPIGPLSLVTNLKEENLFSRVALDKSQRSANERDVHFEFEIVVEW